MRVLGIWAHLWALGEDGQKKSKSQLVGSELVIWLVS